jgi:hypothetical protein
MVTRWSLDYGILVFLECFIRLENHTLLIWGRIIFDYVFLIRIPGNMCPGAPTDETGESAFRGRKSYHYVYFDAETW